jgi:hypothetical protein
MAQSEFLNAVSHVFAGPCAPLVAVEPPATPRPARLQSPVRPEAGHVPSSLRNVRRRCTAQAVNLHTGEGRSVPYWPSFKHLQALRDSDIAHKMYRTPLILPFFLFLLAAGRSDRMNALSCHLLRLSMSFFVSVITSFIRGRVSSVSSRA